MTFYPKWASSDYDLEITLKFIKNTKYYYSLFCFVFFGIKVTLLNMFSDVSDV